MVERNSDEIHTIHDTIGFVRVPFSSGAIFRNGGGFKN